MFGLTILDIIVLITYFGVIIYIGIRASFKIKNAEDYFLGGRKFGKLTSTFASFGQATSADGPAGVATTTYNNGASGIWSSLLMLFVTPLFWITSPWLRRLRILTMGDFYFERYGSKKMAATYAIIATIGMMGLLSVGYMAVTKTTMAMMAKPAIELTTTEQQELSAASELNKLESISLTQLNSDEKYRLEVLRKQNPRGIFSYANEQVLIWTICFLVMIYTALGGLEAAFYTDMLQGVFIILLSFILIPFGWSAINDQYGGSGGMQALSHLHQQLPQNIFEVFGSPLTIDFTWYFILTVALVSGLTVVTQPNQLVTAGAAKDEWSARVGFVSGTFMKRVVTIMWGMLGLTAILLYSGKINNSDLVWGYATRELLGPLNLGLIGLMLASLMAALMSTADCLMITVSGLIVNNLYKPYFKVESQNHLLWAGRISGAIFLIGGAIITTQFDNILQILKFIWEFFVVFAAAFWLGLKWRKANVNGAWWSILGSFSIFYFIPVILPLLFSGLNTSQQFLKQTNPEPVLRTYTARQMDVTANQELITRWENQKNENSEVGQKPKQIHVGDQFTQTYQLPKKSIFWSKGIKPDQNGVLVGGGYLYIELILLDAIGFDLSKNPYALNETVRMLVRLIVPFLLLVIVSLVSNIDQKEYLEPFYQKMRRPVTPEGSEEPESTLVFPNSNWEFYKWNRRDWLGFLLSWVLVAAIIGLLYLVVTIGG